MHSLRHYDWTIQMAAVAFCSYFLAQALTTYVGGILESIPGGGQVVSVRSTGPALDRGEEAELSSLASLEDFQVIAQRNIFNSQQSGEENPVAGEELTAGEMGDTGPAQKTGLEIKVLGTLAVGEGIDRRSSATVSGGSSSKKGSAEVYYPGDEKSFSPNVRLTRVAKDRIEFLNGGRLEFAELEDFAAKKTIFASAEEVHGKKETLEKGAPGPAGPLVASEGNRIVIDQSEIDNALQNLDKLMTEIRIVPNFKGGEPAGMKVLSVKPGSVIAKLGVKRGDILEKVNGQILDMKQGMELFSQMKDMKSFALDVVRGGKNQTLEYEIR